MKITASPIFLIFGFVSLLAALSLAQSSSTNRTTGEFDDPANVARQFEKMRQTDLALDELLLLGSCLTETRQTNILKLLNDYQSANLAQGNSSEIGKKLRILGDLRAGKTNEAIYQVEQELASNVVLVGIGCRRLESLLRQRVDLTELRAARDYCNKYNVKRSRADMQELVVNAFKLLDEAPYK